MADATTESLPPPTRPQVVDEAANAEFRSSAKRFGLDPDDFWVGRYVEYEWDVARLYIETFCGKTRGRRVLEFGCNLGATAIVLSRLGALVSAADVGPKVVELARLNAKRYRAENIEFQLLMRGDPLPYGTGFDLITCNSVLEYISPDDLPGVLQEIDRVLKPGGLLLVLGTSNRLSPKEVHSKRWLSNYIPRPLDRFLGRRQRGIFPWAVRAHLHGYRNLVAADGGERYFALRRKLGDTPAKLAALHALAKLGGLFGLSAGEVTPSFLQVLQKPDGDPASSGDAASGSPWKLQQEKRR